MAMSELTVAELRLKHAQLARQAAADRTRWRAMSAGPAAVSAMHRLRDLDQRVADYEEIIKWVTSG